jgi:DNA-binding response OmpR family regulator
MTPSNSPTVDEATVLVVDDEPDVAELYSAWLSDICETQTAHGAREALAAADESLDVIFLDRQMPDMTGDEVLDRLRERDLNARVVMVTAVDPDFDIVDMPFDEYLTKPVSMEDMWDAVDRMLKRETYDEQLQEYFALASKKATLEARKDPVELVDSEEYDRLDSQLKRLERQADETVSELGESDSFETLFHEFPGGV